MEIINNVLLTLNIIVISYSIGSGIWGNISKRKKEITAYCIYENELDKSVNKNEIQQDIKKENNELYKQYIEGRFNFRIIIGITLAIYTLFSVRAPFLYYQKAETLDAILLLGMGMIPYTVSLFTSIVMLCFALKIEELKKGESIYIILFMIVSFLFILNQVIHYGKIFWPALLLNVLTYLGLLLKSTLKKS